MIFKIQLLGIVILSLLSNISVAQAPEAGDKVNGGVFLHREFVENYWNDWTAYLLMDEKELERVKQAQLAIIGEGKTVAFIGNVSVNCGNDKYYWQSGNNLSNILISEKEIEQLIPDEVMQNAVTLFCG